MVPCSCLVSQSDLVYGWTEWCNSFLSRWNKHRNSSCQNLQTCLLLNTCIYLDVFDHVLMYYRFANIAFHFHTMLPIFSQNLLILCLEVLTGYLFSLLGFSSDRWICFDYRWMNFFPTTFCQALICHQL